MIAIDEPVVVLVLVVVVLVVVVQVVVVVVVLQFNYVSFKVTAFNGFQRLSTAIS